jgi:hypothetical protein
MPFEPTTNNTDATPRASHVAPSKIPTSVEPLAINKKASLRSSTAGPSPAAARRAQGRQSLARASPKPVSITDLSPLSASTSRLGSASPLRSDPEAIFKRLETTKEDVSRDRTFSLISIDLVCRSNPLVELLNAFDWRWIVFNPLPPKKSPKVVWHLRIKAVDRHPLTRLSVVLLSRILLLQ